MKLLVISHLLPGDAEPGAARIEWLARDLAQFGVETHVLAIRREGTRRAEGSAETGAAAVTVVPFGGRDAPGQLASIFLGDGGFARTVVDRPSQEEAVRRGVELARRLAPDAIISSVPPLRVGDVAYRVALETGLPWVIDWRDPLARRPLNVWPSRAYYRACSDREDAWTGLAALHVATAPSHAKALEIRLPGASVAVVPNGWRPSKAGREEPVRGSMLYAGSLTPDIYGFARSFPWKRSMRLRSRITFGRWCHAPFAGEVDYRPWGLRGLEAISRGRKALTSLAFGGARGGGVALAHARRLGLGGAVRVLPWTEPGRSAADLSRAHVLWLSCAGTSERGGEQVLVSKAVKYLSAGRPVFAVVPPECDTADMLRGHAGVFMADPNDPPALDDCLARALDTAPEARFDRDVDHLRWDRLAERLVDAVARAGRGGPTGDAPGHAAAHGEQ